MSQQPTPPALDGASAAALKPLVTQRNELNAALKTTVASLAVVNTQWRTLEGKALAAANLDPGSWQVDPTGTKFIPHIGLPR